MKNWNVFVTIALALVVFLSSGCSKNYNASVDHEDDSIVLTLNEKGDDFGTMIMSKVRNPSRSFFVGDKAEYVYLPYAESIKNLQLPSSVKTLVLPSLKDLDLSHLSGIRRIHLSGLKNTSGLILPRDVEFVELYNVNKIKNLSIVSPFSRGHHGSDLVYLIITDPKALPARGEMVIGKYENGIEAPVEIYDWAKIAIHNAYVPSHACRLEKWIELPAEQL